MTEPIFFLVVGDGISKGGNHKLQLGRFSWGHWESRRVLLHWEDSTVWEQVIREMGASPSLEVCNGFNNQLLLDRPRLPITVWKMGTAISVAPALGAECCAAWQGAKREPPLCALRGGAVPCRKSWRLVLLTAAFLLWLEWKDKNDCRNSSRCIQEEVQVLSPKGGLSLHRELGKAEAGEDLREFCGQWIKQKYGESSLRMCVTSLSVTGKSTGNEVQEKEQRMIGKMGEGENSCAFFNCHLSSSTMNNVRRFNEVSQPLKGLLCIRNTVLDEAQCTSNELCRELIWKFLMYFLLRWVSDVVSWYYNACSKI